MCGIIGVVKNKSMYPMLDTDLKRFFRQGLYVDTLRGGHSTGAFGTKIHVPKVNEKEEYYVHYTKKAVPGPVFLGDKSFNDHTMSRWSTYKYVVGHNRAATYKANINEDENAHPFIHGRIVLVHNGTIDNPEVLVPSDYQFDVDSDALAHSINANGLKETLDEVRGTYSLVWCDMEDGTLNFIRNHGRPMEFGFLQNKHGIIFGSERPMLYWLAQRNKINVDYFASPKPHQHIKLDPNSDTFEVIDLDIKTPRRFFGPRSNNGGPLYDQWKQAKAAAKKNREQKGTIPPNPASKKGKVHQKLHEHNLKYGQEVVFWYHSFVGYKKRKKNQEQMGTLYGYMESDPWMPVMVSAVPKSHLSYLPDHAGWRFSGKVMNIHNDSKETYAVVHWQDCVYLGAETDKKKTEIAKVEDIKNYKFPKYNSGVDMLLEAGMYFWGPDGTCLDQKEFEKGVKNGCAVCADVIPPEAHKNIAWTKHEEPLCEVCCRNPENYEHIEFPPLQVDG